MIRLPRLVEKTPLYHRLYGILRPHADHDDFITGIQALYCLGGWRDVLHFTVDSRADGFTKPETIQDLCEAFQTKDYCIECKPIIGDDYPTLQYLSDRDIQRVIDQMPAEASPVGLSDMTDYVLADRVLAGCKYEGLDSYIRSCKLLNYPVKKMSDIPYDQRTPQRFKIAPELRGYLQAKRTQPWG